MRRRLGHPSRRLLLCPFPPGFVAPRSSRAPNAARRSHVDERLNLRPSGAADQDTFVARLKQDAETELILKAVSPCYRVFLGRLRTSIVAINYKRHRMNRLALSIAMTLIVTTAGLSAAQASTHTWTAASAGSFATAGNWNSGAGGAPGSGDAVVFSSSTKPCTIGATVSVASINISVNVTVTQSAGITLTVNGDFTQSAGTFSGGNSTISISGNLNLSGGTFSSTSGILAIGGAFNKTSGTFTHSSGRVLLNSTNDQTFATNGATFYDLAINDGLTGYWKLDDGGTPIKDSSGWAQSGTLFNTPTWAAAPSLQFTDSNAMVLNGTTQYAEVTRTAQLEPASLTVAVWAKRNGNQVTFAKMVEKQYTTATPFDSWALNVNHTGSDSTIVTWDVSVNISGTPTANNISSATGAMPDGTWTHIVGVYDPAGSAPQERIYINGVLNASTTSTNAIVYDTTTTGDFYLGQNGRNQQYFAGTLDEVRVYNRALSDAEIYSLYIGNQPGTTTSVHSMTGAPTVANDLTLGSGTLSVGSNNMTVSGSWDNYGGIFSAGTGARSR